MKQYLFESSIQTINALNYFAFYKHYQILQASLPYEFSTQVGLINAVIQRVRLNEPKENTIQNLENLKKGIADTYNNSYRALVALACLCQKIKEGNKPEPTYVDVRNDYELTLFAQELYTELGQNYWVLFQDIQAKFDKIQTELMTMFPAVFKRNLAPFFAAKDALLGINPDDIDNPNCEDPVEACLLRIQEAFIKTNHPIKLLVKPTDDDQDFETTYWREVLQMSQTLGYDEQWLRTNSIATFYSRLQNEKEKAELFEAKK
jgi:hypothetical protein